MGGARNPKEVETKLKWEEVFNGICASEIILGTNDMNSLLNRIAWKWINGEWLSSQPKHLNSCLKEFAGITTACFKAHDSELFSPSCWWLCPDVLCLCAMLSFWQCAFTMQTCSWWWWWETTAWANKIILARSIKNMAVVLLIIFSVKPFSRSLNN